MKYAFTVIVPETWWKGEDTFFLLHERVLNEIIGFLRIIQAMI